MYENKSYKSAQTVIQTLTDIVSKNRNLLLNIPVKGNGSIDDQEVAILEEVATWMKVNAECIFDTRPWKVYGEGPAISEAAPIAAQGFNEGKGKPFGPADMRFTTKGDTLYAVVFGWPDNGKVTIKSLSEGNTLRPGTINKVQLLGGGELPFKRNSEALEIMLPDNRPALAYANVLKIN